MINDNWTINAIPDLHGKRIIVTGGNSGIGYEAALVLAAKGASVILAVRSVEKGNDAAQQIRDAHSSADVEVMPLDLADLASIRTFAGAYLGRYPTLDVLINNAGVMALPHRKTADGFEMQFGTNHLGHFALTGLLLPALLAVSGTHSSSQARVVTVSSGAHRPGVVNFGDLQSERGYQRWRAYSQSKLSNLLFAYELQRRFEASHAKAISVGVHPGYVATNLQAAGPRMEGSRINELFMGLGNRLFAGTATQGATPTLYAATSPEVNGGEYIGPSGRGAKHGIPSKQRSNNRSYDVDSARSLWEVSETLTGVKYTFPEMIR